MTKQTEMICISKDEKYMAEQTELLNKALAACKEALSEYKQLTGQALNPNDWRAFLNNPSGFTKKVLQDAVKTPAGIQREKYLDMVELPNFYILDGILSIVNPSDMYKSNYCKNPDFFDYDGQIVLLSEKAKKHIDRNNVYVPDGRGYKEIQKFLKAANSLLKINSDFKDTFGRGMIVFKYDSDTRQLELRADSVKRFLK